MMHHCQKDVKCELKIDVGLVSKRMLAKREIGKTINLHIVQSSINN
uniref:Uncharacterized protein n=1 Tax=Rhizophora mucronata TaxID=61149 RepID=A0A2P2QID0_RHIMU